MENYTVQLSDLMEIPNYGHILYPYEDMSAYIANAVAYIATGINLGHHILMIENEQLYHAIRLKLGEVVSVDSIHVLVHHADNTAFYELHGDFHWPSIVRHFNDLLLPLLSQRTPVRTWAHVQWKPQDNIYRKLDEFERIADKSVTDLALMSVCAYDGTQIPASLLTKTLHSHSFLMTDDAFVRSPLYQQGRC